MEERRAVAPARFGSQHLHVRDILARERVYAELAILPLLRVLAILRADGEVDVLPYAGLHEVIALPDDLVHLEKHRE